MRHHDQQTGMSALRAEKFDTEISFIFAVAHNCQSTHPGLWGSTSRTLQMQIKQCDHHPAAYFTTKHALGRIFTLQNNVNSNDDVDNDDGCEDAAMLVMTMMMKMQLCALLKYSETCIVGRFTQTKSAPKRRQ
jgi:hypothetical protein